MYGTKRKRMPVIKASFLPLSSWIFAIRSFSLSLFAPSQIAKPAIANFISLMLTLMTRSVQTVLKRTLLFLILLCYDVVTEYFAKKVWKKSGLMLHKFSLREHFLVHCTSHPPPCFWLSLVERLCKGEKVGRECNMHDWITLFVQCLRCLKLER